MPGGAAPMSERRRLPAVLCALMPAVALAQDGPVVAVPSGQTVVFQEVIRDAAGFGGLTYRFRFIAPGISRVGGGVDFETAAGDMDHLCNSFAVQRISSIGPQPSQIVISLADRAIAFGQAAPEATQFFEAYRVEDGVCIWESF